MNTKSSTGFQQNPPPAVWNDPPDDTPLKRLRMEAEKRFRQFSLPETKEEWEELRPVLRERIAGAMRLKRENLPELDYREHGRIRLKGYSIVMVSFLGAAGRRITGNLYLPDGKGPFPAVINLHGHWQQGRLAARVQSRGHVLALSGFVCLCIDVFGAGERSSRHGVFEYHGALLGGALENIGETLMGIQTADNMRGVDLLCSLKCVDPARIGATGASGGGNQTMWLAAMDERIQAALPVVSVGSFASYTDGVNCICELLPDGLDICEESGVLALTAPRALKICNALHDSNPTFHVTEMLRSFKEARKVYRALGAEDKLSFEAFNTPHGYWPEIRESMLGFFELQLKHKGTGAALKEPAFEALEEERLMVYPKGRRPADFMTIVRFCREKGKSLRHDLLSRKEIPGGEARKNLAELLKTGPVLTPPRLKVSRNGKRGPWEAGSLESEDGRLLPFLYRKGTEHPEKIRLLSSARGKSELAGSLMLRQALDSGDGVLIFDLFASGERGNDITEFLPAYHSMARGMQWLGKRLMGEWVRDYLLAGSFASGELGGKELSFGGRADAACAALFASDLSPLPECVILEDMLPSLQYQEKRSAPLYLTMAVLIPGILEWGDISLALALSHAARKEILSLKYSDASEADAERLKRLLREAEILSGKLRP